MPPRITPVGAAERDPQMQALLDRVDVGTTEANIFTTLVRHPELFRRWIAFGGTLLHGSLPARDRELLILRTGWNCGAEYEWAQHVVIGARVGLTAEEMDRVAGALLSGWPAADRLLLEAADELHRSYRLSDATWAALAERYDTAQLIEIPMLVGHYHLVAMTLLTLGIELDEGLTGFPA